jgi:NAD(P)-dependent dehydrogenase (short-subunit alcohol dehydrogenase family)
MGRFDGQVALITGGGRGIGRSVALALAAENASIALDDIYFLAEGGESAGKELTAELESAGAGPGNTLLLTEDVRISAGAQAMVDATVQRFGRLDILVNCAGNNVRGRIQELTEDQWDSVLGLHLKGHFLSCQAAVKQMLTQNSGRVITVASRGSIYYPPSSKLQARSSRNPASTAYASAKAGIMGLSTVLALELWETGITVNCLLPSATTQLFPESKPRMVGGVPASTNMDPDYVAPLVAFLCSAEAKNISGRLIYASGGDVLIYGPLLDVAGSRMIRNQGKWTIDELAGVIPSLIGSDSV